MSSGRTLQEHVDGFLKDTNDAAENKDIPSSVISEGLKKTSRFLNFKNIPKNIEKVLQEDQQKNNSFAHSLEETTEVLYLMMKSMSQEKKDKKQILYYPHDLSQSMKYVKEDLANQLKWDVSNFFQVKKIQGLNTSIENAEVFFPICYSKPSKKSPISGDELTATLYAFLNKNVSEVTIFLGRASSADEVTSDQNFKDSVKSFSDWLLANKTILAEVCEKFEKKGKKLSVLTRVGLKELDIFKKALNFIETLETNYLNDLVASAMRDVKGYIGRQEKQEKAEQKQAEQKQVQSPLLTSSLFANKPSESVLYAANSAFVINRLIQSNISVLEIAKYVELLSQQGVNLTELTDIKSDEKTKRNTFG